MGLGISGFGHHGPAQPDLGPLQQLRGYWEGLRRFGRLPARSDIDPRGLAGTLENSFLLERIAPNVAKFRLCGMMVHDLMGMEPAGMPLSVLFDPMARARLSTVLAGVFDAPSALELWLDGERGLGRPALTGRMLILPLTDVAGEVRLALGCLVTAGSIGRQPRRFTISTVLAEQLPQMTAPQPVPALELAEDPAPYRPARSAKPFLRLVSARD